MGELHEGEGGPFPGGGEDLPRLESRQSGRNVHSVHKAGCRQRDDVNDLRKKEKIHTKTGSEEWMQEVFHTSGMEEDVSNGEITHTFTDLPNLF